MDRPMRPVRNEDVNSRFKRGQIVKRIWINNRIEEYFLIKEAKQQGWYLAYCCNDGIERDYHLSPHESIYNNKSSYDVEIVEG